MPLKPHALANIEKSNGQDTVSRFGEECVPNEKVDEKKSDEKMPLEIFG